MKLIFSLFHLIIIKYFYVILNQLFIKFLFIIFLCHSKINISIKLII